MAKVTCSLIVMNFNYYLAHFILMPAMALASTEPHCIGSQSLSAMPLPTAPGIPATPQGLLKALLLQAVLWALK
jgi:hypothetical protein